MTRLLLSLLLLLLAFPAGADTAGCGGRDLLAGTSAAERAKLVGSAPYATGNFWQATRDGTTITLAGSYHLNDPRFDAIMPKLLPYLDRAAVLLAEAGPDQEQKIKADISQHPQRLILGTGKTLPELLSPEEWNKLTAALKPQGVPAVMVARMQPWYVAMMLGLPSCKLGPEMLQGLDKRLMAAAAARHIPVEALEPWDTTLKVFAEMGQTEQLALLKMSLTSDASPADLNTTLADAYFRGQHQLIWAWSRQQALAAGGGAAGRESFDRMESLLLTGRTRAWLAPLLRAAAGRDVMVVVGAAHLGGREGLLELLAQKGFTITRLPI